MKRVLIFFTLAALLLMLTPGAAALDAPLPATLQIQTATPDTPTAAAVLTFPDLPIGFSRHGSIVWYLDGVPYTLAQSLCIQRGQTACARFTLCFSEDMALTHEVTAVLTCGAQRWTYSGILHAENYDQAYYAYLATLSHPYRITISRFENIVIVWAQDETGAYSRIQNVFACSTGSATPRGIFQTGERLRWHTLFGSEKSNWHYVYGQYITRITNSILFHSVPYLTRSPDDLEPGEFNLLGSRASQGCIRLTVEAAKWIYDNVPIGTQVEMVDTLPPDTVAAPTAPKIDPDAANAGWDPTDPLNANPWRQPA